MAHKNKLAEVVEPEVERETESEDESVVIEETATSVKLGFGAVTVVVDAALNVPQEAGKLSPEQVKRIARAPRGIGLACDNAALSLEKALDAGFVAPPGVTPDGLRLAGEQAEAIDVYIGDVEVLLNTLKQGNLLLDSAAYEALRKLNGQVKAQAKFAPEFNRIFASTLSFFDHNSKRKTKKTSGESAEK